MSNFFIFLLNEFLLFFPFFQALLSTVSFPFYLYSFLLHPLFPSSSPCCFSFLEPWPRSPGPWRGLSLQAGLWVLPDMPFRAWEPAAQTFWLHCHCLLGCSAAGPGHWISIRILTASSCIFSLCFPPLPHHQASPKSSGSLATCLFVGTFTWRLKLPLYPN